MFVGFRGLVSQCSAPETPQPDVGWQTLAIFNFLSQHGSGWLASATVATSVRNFPLRDRGAAVGLAKGFFAVSSGCVAQYYRGAFAPDSLAFLEFLSIAVPSAALGAPAFWGSFPEERRATYAMDSVARPSWRPYYASASALLALLLASSAAERWTASRHDACQAEEGGAASAVAAARCPEPSDFVPMLSLVGTAALLLAVALLPWSRWYGPGRVHVSHALLSTDPIMQIEMAGGDAGLAAAAMGFGPDAGTATPAGAEVRGGEDRVGEERGRGSRGRRGRRRVRTGR